MKSRIVLILGTTRINNESRKVAAFLKGLLEETGRVEVDYLDLGKAGIPIMEERLGRLESPPPALVMWNEKIKASQGIVIVAPEYKNSYPGSLKNFIDYLPRAAFQYLPMAIATVSSLETGGVNCLAQLRLLCLAMAGMPIPDHLPVPNVTELFPDDNSDPNDNFSAISREFVLEYLKYVKVFADLKHQ